MPPDHVYLSPDGQSATLIFEGGLPAAAEADTYAFRVLDNVTDGAGNALDGNADNTPGGDYEVAFTVAIDGDLQVDGKVDRDDLAVFLGAFDTPEPGAADLDQDGDCDRDDLAVFLGAYGNELEEPVGQAMGVGGEAVVVEMTDGRVANDALLGFAELFISSREGRAAREAEACDRSVVSSGCLADQSVRISMTDFPPRASGATRISVPQLFQMTAEPQVSDPSGRSTATEADYLTDVLAVPALDVPLGV